MGDFPDSRTASTNQAIRTLHAADETLAETDLLTVKQYADLFGVHFQTVYTAIRQQRLPYPVVRPTGGDAIRIQVPRVRVNIHKSA